VGGYRVGLFAAAARPFGHPRGHLRDALFVGLWATFNGGALLGPMVSKWTSYWGIEYRPTLIVLGGVALLAALLAAVLGLVVLKGSRGEPEPGDSGRLFSGRILLAALGLIALCVLPWGSYGVLGMLQADAIWELEERLDHEVLYALNPAILILGSLVLVPLLAILHVARVHVPTTVPIGAGLVLFGLGVAVFAAGLPGDTLVAFIGGTVVMTVGELLLGPFVLSRVAGDMHWRLAPLLIGVWLAGTGLMSTLTSALSIYSSAHGIVAWIGVGTAVPAGLLLLALSWPLRRLFLPDPPPAAEAPAAGEAPDMDRWQTEQFGV
jgi:dipeptide/tripeptide permease